MKNTLLSSFAGLALLLAMGCKKEPHLITYEEAYASPVYTQLEYRDTGEVAFTYQEYRVGKFLDSGAPAHRWQSWDKVTSRGPAVLVDIYSGERFSNLVVFGLEFWADPPADNPWTEEHLKAMFKPGRVFPFGEGPGRVDLSFAHQPPDFFEDERSKATYLAKPTGELTITQVEDYSYMPPGRERVQGLLIHCTFEGQLGQYDLLGTFLNEDFTTEVAVEVRNGAAVFFLPYP